MADDFFFGVAGKLDKGVIDLNELGIGYIYQAQRNRGWRQML